VRSVTQMSGPGLAGLVIQALSAPVALGVDAVSYVASASLVSRIRRREARPERAPAAHLGREIGEGLRFVLGDRMLRAIGATTGTFTLFSSMVGAMMIVLLARDLRLTPAMIGLVFSIGSIGALVGAFSARRVSGWLGQGPAIWISIAATAPFGLLMPIAHRGWLLWVAALGWAVTSFGVVVYNVIQVSFRQGLTPERLLGRMNATMRFLAWGPMPLGSLIGGVLGQTIGVRPTLWIGAAGMILAFVPAYLSPLRSLRELPTHAEPEYAS
jgi:predicted MFS family arabinose efflux permease